MIVKSQRIGVAALILVACSGAFSANEGFVSAPMMDQSSTAYINVVEQKAKVISLRKTAKKLKRLKRLKQFAALEKARVCVDEIYVSDSTDFKEMDLCFKDLS